MDIAYTLPVNTTLHNGKYKIVRFISSGGFGCTYEAEHVMLGKRVAIKEFFVQDFCNRDEESSQVITSITSKMALVDKLRGKFINEARALSIFDHPGIVHVSDVFEENGTAYYVMDYIDGMSINDAIKQNGAIDERVALGYIRQICEALKYVHAQNRLHLDIKPANVMIDNHGRAVLIDFGASKQYDNVGNQDTSMLAGRTPGYAPLEQMSNNVSKFTPATDIYALGASLYKMLTTITPIDAVRRAGGEQMAPLPQNISANTRNAIASAMELNKDKRPQSIEAFMAILDNGGAAAPPKMPNAAFNQSADDTTEIVGFEPPMPPQFGPKPPVETADPGFGQPAFIPQQPKKKNRTWLWVLLGIVAVAAIVVTICLIAGKSRGDYTYDNDNTDVEYGGITDADGNKVSVSADGRVSNVVFVVDNERMLYTGQIHIDENDESYYPEGEGVAKYDNFTYTGQFKEGQFYGHGLIEANDGSSLDGEFVEGRMVTGTVTNTDGTYFTGTLDANGNPLDGEYIDTDGSLISTFEDGVETHVK